MKMSNQDLEWLASQQPQRTEVDRNARERALAALTQHTDSRRRERHFRFASHPRRGTFGLAAATGTAGLAAAAVLLAGVGGGGTNGAKQSGRDAKTSVAVVQHHGVKSPLVRLADYVSETSTPPGNATLVARTTTTAGNSVTVYDLYANNGQYFFSQDESGLAGQVSAGDNLAGGLFAREIAAAELAANGNVQTAAQHMADAPDPSHVISSTATSNTAASQAKLKLEGYSQACLNSSAPGSLFDNYVWENSQDALIAGSGDPEVRAGVLQLLATLPDVTVTRGTSGGQPTLVLTAGTAEMGCGYTEQLTINSDSGVPIQFVGGPTGGTPSTTVNYKVSRVTFPNLPGAAATGTSGTGSGA
jgi:hypothetical protein